MNIHLSRPLFLRALHRLRGNLPATLLHHARNRQQRFHLRTRMAACVVALHVLDKLGILQVRSGHGPVDRVAVLAVVQGRDVRGDELSVARREGAGGGALWAQEEVGQRRQAGIYIWAVGGQGYHAGLIGG